MAEVILGYKMIKGWAEPDQPGGWSFTIYRKGTVRFRYYLYDGPMVHSERIKIPQSVADELYQALEKQKSHIDALLPKTENWSKGGTYDMFNFLGKKTSSFNISKIPENLIKDYTDDEFSEKMIRAENEIMSVFESVCPLLEPYGLHVTFWPFECRWNGYEDFYKKIWDNHRVNS